MRNYKSQILPHPNDVKVKIQSNRKSRRRYPSFPYHTSIKFNTMIKILQVSDTYRYQNVHTSKFSKYLTHFDDEIWNWWKFSKYQTHGNVEIWNLWKFSKYLTHLDVEICNLWKFSKYLTHTNNEIWNFPSHRPITKQNASILTWGSFLIG
jgi:hypothetical protein